MTEKKEKFGIIIPIYNGEKYVDDVLSKIDKQGYISAVTVIDDASTDKTHKILKDWSRKKGLDVESMNTNGQKIGSIKKVLEKKRESGTLPEYIVLHDGDSFLDLEDSSNGTDIMSALGKSIEFMEKNGWSGMGFKDIPRIDSSSNVLEKIQYKEYLCDRAIHSRLAKKDKMRCIPGAGAIFKADDLISALEKHSLRHNGDDMETTVLLQRMGKKTGYYNPHVISERGYDSSEHPQLVVRTKVPSTFKHLVKQRVRWTKGAIETYLKEGGFHLTEMKNGTRLGAQALYETVKIATYPGWYYAAAVYPELVIPVSIIGTGILNTAFTLWNPEFHEEHPDRRSKIKSVLRDFFPLATYTFMLDTLRMPISYGSVGSDAAKKGVKRADHFYDVLGNKMEEKEGRAIFLA